MDPIATDTPASTPVDASSAGEPGGRECTTDGLVRQGCDGHGGCGGQGGCSGHGHGAAGGHGGGSSYVPVLDARTIDPVIRQSAIFGVLVGLPPAGSVTIVTDVDPAPIAGLLDERLPGEYDVATEQPSDDEWCVTFRRH